jgi:L-threonylcarbamoyladenylate synthase
MIVNLERALERIALGEAVAYPTETIYGLAADASSEQAVSRLEALKGRASGQGMSVLLADPADLDRWVERVPAQVRALAARFWPGPLTIVLRGADCRLVPVSTPFGVGFRCSSYATARALARASLFPILSTSCNASSLPPAHTVAEVAAYFGADFPVLGGEPAGGLPPSTVVAVGADGSLVSLRQGGLSLEDLRGSAGPRSDLR